MCHDTLNFLWAVYKIKLSYCSSNAGSFGEYSNGKAQERQNLAEAITISQTPQHSHSAGFEVGYPRLPLLCLAYLCTGQCGRKEADFCLWE